MSFCPKCGAEIQEGAQFCQVCGFDTANQNSEPIE